MAVDKSKLDKLVSDMDKKFGKGALILPDENYKVDGVEAIPSGSMSLDNALGIGGYARGRIIEIYGQESSGKTTLAIHAMVNAQEISPDQYVGIIDAEHAFDLTYAENIGLDKTRFTINQPDCGEQGLEILDSMIDTAMFSIIVVDSVAALTPKSEIEGDMGDANVGKQARMMSQALRKIVSKTMKTNTTVIFINQLREKIGVMFGNPIVTTGGNALKFYASQRIDVSRTGQIKDGDEVTANKTRVKIVKNKVAPPFKVGEFDIIFGKGIDTIGEILDVAVEIEVVKKSGSWFHYGTTRLGQGREAARQLLVDNPELIDEILGKIYQ